MTVRRRGSMKIMIPLASMGDIAFLLIIFFMLTSSFMRQNQRLEPAGSAFIENVENAQLSVTLDEDEKLWVQGLEVGVGEIAGMVEVLVEEHPRDVLVHVNIDRNLKRKAYMPVMEALSEAGVQLVMTGQRTE